MYLSVQNCVQDVDAVVAVQGDDSRNEQTERQSQSAAGVELGQHEQTQ